ncbi:hypothetical protein ACIQ9E_04525 [Streptomyces sp. NPDC094448]|uniref:hypothetical protein n=1 Tax=Streptomyces sp. NPDC094448 TaxID=3366063 RepID=UPI00381475F3
MRPRPWRRPARPPRIPEGGARQPLLLIHRGRGRGLGLGARADGTARRPRVVAGAGAHLQPERDIGALLRHEAAHITARDVGRVRLAVAAWWILLAGVTVPLAAELALRPGSIGGAVSLRPAVVLAVFGLTLFGAPAPFALTALRRGRPRPRLVPAVAGALFVLPTAAVWIPSAGSEDTSPRRVLLGSTVPTAPEAILTPLPPVPAPASEERVTDLDDLPVLPPPEAEGRQPVRDPFIACLALNAGRSALWTDPAGRKQTAELLAAVEDTVLRAVSAVLRRSYPAPVHSDVQQAAILRCDLLRRYAR